MSTVQRLTMIGLYNYDHNIFNELSLPDGYDVDTFRDSFLLEHGEKPVLYPDADFMRFSIGVVSRKWRLELERIYQALSEEYDPIYNYDRYEEWTDDGTKSHDEKVKADYTNTRTPDLENKVTHNTTETLTHDTTQTITHDTTDESSQSVNGTSERQVAAFNSSNYEPAEQTITNSGTSAVTRTGDDTTTMEGDDTNVTTGDETTTTKGSDEVLTKGTLEDRDGKENSKNKHVGHIYGNVGVTTSASMVSEVVKQRFEKNLYAIAGRIFANELLIQIY